MNRDFFPTIDDALSEGDELVKRDRDDSHDRAIISAFYNGRSTMGADQATREGISEITNHLFGYDTLNQAKTQLAAVYSQPDHVWAVDLPDAPPEVKDEWQMLLTKKFNEILRRAGKFKPEYDSLCGDATLYGRGSLYFRDDYSWCPRHCEPLVPRKSGQRPDEIPYIFMRDQISLRDLHRFHRMATRNGHPGWKAKELKVWIDMLTGNIAPGVGAISTSGTSAFDDPAELENDRQEGAIPADNGRVMLPVYFLYTSRPKEEGCPWDLTIIPRNTEAVKSMIRGRGQADRVLNAPIFDQEKFYRASKHFIHPFFLDANIGGRATWHRVRGLGRLNYETDVDVEEFFNEAMTGAKESVRRLYATESSADIEMLERFMADNEWSNILPPGVQVAQVQQNPNFQYAFSVLEILRQNSAKKGAGAIGNSRGERAANELEVQALERQGRNAQVLAHRMSEWYQSLDALGCEVFRRFVQQGAIPSDEGYWEIKEFQDWCEQKGIPLDYLRYSRKGESQRYEIKTNRSAGEGDRVQQVMVNRMLLDRIHLFSPQAQEIIKRRVVASETNDYELAKHLVPEQQEPPGDQVARANNENDAALLRGIAGYVPPLNKDDIHGVHVPEHIGALEALNAKGEAQGWEPMDAAGFQSIGAHAMAHVQQIAGSDKNMARQFEQAIQELARMAQEHEANMQQRMAAQEVTPMDQAKMEKMQHDAAMEERKQQALEEHRAASLDLAERKAADTGATAAGNLALQEQQLAAKERSDTLNRVDSEVARREQMAETRRQQTVQGEATGKTPNQR